MERNKQCDRVHAVDNMALITDLCKEISAKRGLILRYYLHEVLNTLRHHKGHRDAT